MNNEWRAGDCVLTSPIVLFSLDGPGCDFFFIFDHQQFSTHSVAVKEVISFFILQKQGHEVELLSPTVVVWEGEFIFKKTLNSRLSLTVGWRTFMNKRSSRFYRM